MNEQRIFLAALEKADPSARAAFLDQACDGDNELRYKVEELLKAHGELGDFIAEPLMKDAVADVGPTIDLSPHKTQRRGRSAGSPVTPAASPMSATEGAGIVEFLDPPERPGSMGRLDHYELISVLGRGGFGTVFKAFDEKLHRMVAIKVLAPELAVNASSRARFSREARAAAAVRHDHIIDIHAVEDEPLPYLVMECIAGQTLQDKIDRVGPLPLKEILRIGYQIASGLAAAHTQGLIHRDIKPVNILLENGIERVKITDFGLARAVDDSSLSTSGLVIGTPQFMSPEQAQSKPFDHRSDLFSLGSTLYVLCTGRLPFHASGSLAVLKRVAEDQPRPIREINPDIPQWLADIVSKLQAKDPEQRFQTAREVAELLAEYLAELQIHGSIRNPAAHARTAVVASLVDKPIASKLTPVKTRLSWRILASLGGVWLLLTLGIFWLTHRGAKDTPPTSPEKKPNAEVATIQPQAPGLLTVPFEEKQAVAHQAAWAEHLGVPTEIENSLGMKLRLIPPGQYDMGIAPADIQQLAKTKFTSWAGWAKYAGPVQPIVIQEPFYLGIQEVTVGQYRKFAEAVDYKTNAEKSGLGGSHWIKGKTLRRPEWTWRSPAFAQTEDHPAVHIAWDDAQAFCEWLGEEEGRTYTLPSEHQWEYACRAGSAAAWSFGSDAGQLSQYAVVRSPKATEPVGSRKANAFGLFDMHGNALEWCSDAWVPFRADPTLPCPDHPADANHFVQRGGCFVMHEITSQSGFRIGQLRASDGSAEGFRVMMRVAKVRR